MQELGAHYRKWPDGKLFNKVPAYVIGKAFDSDSEISNFGKYLPFANVSGWSSKNLRCTPENPAKFSTLTDSGAAIRVSILKKKKVILDMVLNTKFIAKLFTREKKIMLNRKTTCLITAITAFAACKPADPTNGSQTNAASGSSPDTAGICMLPQAVGELAAKQPDLIPSLKNTLTSDQANQVRKVATNNSDNLPPCSPEEIQQWIKSNGSSEILSSAIQNNQSSSYSLDGMVPGGNCVTAWLANVQTALSLVTRCTTQQGRDDAKSALLRMIAPI
jgi:hypothetical protein